MSLVQLKLRNEVVKFRSDGEPSGVAKSAELVQSLLDSVENRTKGASVPTHHLVLLAMMELAEQYTGAKDRFRTHQAQTQEKIDEIGLYLSESGLREK